MIDSKCERSSRNMPAGTGWSEGVGVGGRGTVNLLVLNIGDKFEWLIKATTRLLW
jgi:hypothetical protein